MSLVRLAFGALIVALVFFFLGYAMAMLDMVVR